MVRLTDADREAITAAVAAEEQQTSGEIAVVITPQSGEYLGVSLAASLTVAFTLPWFIGWYLQWGAFPHLWLLQLGSFLLVQSLLSASSLPARLAPRKLANQQAATNAREQFLRLGLNRTLEHNGLMIFISEAEHYAEILADKAIDAKCGAEEWQQVLQQLMAKLRSGQARVGIVEAVQRCGEDLREHFPAGQHNPNELPDVTT